MLASVIGGIVFTVSVTRTDRAPGCCQCQILPHCRLSVTVPVTESESEAARAMSLARLSLPGFKYFMVRAAGTVRVGSGLSQRAASRSVRPRPAGRATAMITDSTITQWHASESCDSDRDQRPAAQPGSDMVQVGLEGARRRPGGPGPGAAGLPSPQAGMRLRVPTEGPRLG